MNDEASSPKVFPGSAACRAPCVPVGLLAGCMVAWPAFAAETTRLEDIVVTATWLETPVEELPASVSVLGPEAIRDAATQHLEELLPQVPSLSWAGASSRPRYFQLRGIGELEQYQGAPNPSVGFIVDEIDFSGIGMVATLFDVEQVEVLRGPQGTRYGANALAGLVKVKTREPRPEPELEVEATGGEDGLVGAGLVAGGVLGRGGQGSAWRVALQRTASNGFRRNAFLGRNDTNERDELTARARVRLLPTDGWTADLTLMHADLDNGYDAFAIDNSLVTQSDRPGRDAQRSTGASADLTWDVADDLALRSITAWADSSIVASFDGDWGNDAFWGEAGPYDFFSLTERERKTLSQDLRVTGSAGEQWYWIAGAYLLRLEEDNAQRDDGRYLEDAFERALDSRYRATSIAGYGQAERRVGQGTTLSAGLRLEQREATYRDSDGLAFSPRDAMWGGQVSVARELGESLHAWASIARGFKAGGFNIGVAIPEERLEFGPEYAWSAEGGIKGHWDGRGLAADVSVFFLRREDQQVATSFQADPQDPLTFVYYTDNAARGRAYGLEGSVDWQATTRWRLSGSLSLMDSEYLGYTLPDRVLDGREWAHAPAWKYSLSATWRHPRGWMARADLSGQDAFYFDASHDERAGAYSLLNLRAGYEAEAWSVHVWIRNAFDERYPLRGFYFGNEPPDFPPKVYVRLGDPRQAGVTARFRF
jgi:iron complex outermembrane receptor protein